jgi:hypothetical protein
MHPACRLLAVTVLSVGACADSPEVSVASSPKIVMNRIVMNRIVMNKLAASKVAAGKLATAQVSDGVFTVNTDAAADLLATDGGREVLGALVACALPETSVIEATTADGTFDFFGDAGLAPEWIAHPLYADSKRWVSACLFARINSADVAISISMRGPSPALGTDSDERSALPLQEGAFFGNYFTPKDEPIQWFACRGIDKAQGNAGDLVSRNCAAPDPAKPGFTLCGFTYAGDCGTFGSAHACEQFALGGTFFQRCHGEPTTGGKFPLASPSFSQVITTYVRL